MTSERMAEIYQEINNQMSTLYPHRELINELLDAIEEEKNFIDKIM